jgi:HD-like signal output (HDOD) protein
LILSGFTNEEAVLCSIGPAHQFFAKPCEPSALAETIDRMLVLRRRLHDDRMAPIIGRIQNLPKRPAIYDELVTRISHPVAQATDIAHIVEKDVALTAEVLRLVNSAFFGVTNTVDSVTRAIVYLGLETLQAIVIGAQAFRAAAVPVGVDIERLWDHSLLVAALMRAIATAERWSTVEVGQAFLAGLLHEIGFLLLATAQPQQFLTTRADPARCADAEVAAFGCSRFEAGAYLLGLWGFPFSVVEAIADQPSVDASNRMAFALRSANHLALGPADEDELLLRSPTFARYADVCHDMIPVAH